jgi:hypothetical protein
VTAYMIGWENIIGSIEVGKRADLVVASQNLFEIKPSEIHNTEAVMTMLNGKVVFDRDKQVSALDVATVEVTNPHLQDGISKEQLDLLVVEEMPGFPLCEHTHEVTAVRLILP